MSTNYATHTANGRNFLIVEVPKDAKDFKISSIGNLHYNHSFEVVNTLTFHEFEIVNLFTPNLSILFVAEQATEDDAAEVVDYKNVPTGGDDYQDYYRNYEGPQEESEWPWIAGYPIKSIQSLIRHHFPNSNQNHLILEIC